MKPPPVRRSCSWTSSVTCSSKKARTSAQNSRVSASSGTGLKFTSVLRRRMRTRRPGARRLVAAPPRRSPATSAQPLARRKNSCTSDSRVNPKPPWVWMATAPACSAASAACTKAIDARAPSASGSWSANHAAWCTSRRAASIAIAASTNGWAIAWKEPMAAPNAWRSLAYCTPSASAASPRPTSAAAVRIRHSSFAAAKRRTRRRTGQDLDAVGEIEPRQRRARQVRHRFRAVGRRPGARAHRHAGRRRSGRPRPRARAAGRLVLRATAIDATSPAKMRSSAARAASSSTDASRRADDHGLDERDGSRVATEPPPRRWRARRDRRRRRRGPRLTPITDGRRSCSWSHSAGSHPRGSAARTRSVLHCFSKNVRNAACSASCSSPSEKSAYRSTKSSASVTDNDSFLSGR